MGIERRVDRLEKLTTPEEPPMTFRLCEAPSGLTAEEHAEWHRQRGEEVGVEFTLDLGAARVTDADHR